MKLNKFISPVIFMGLLFNVLYPSNVYTIFKENKSCITSSINSEYWFYNKVNYLGIDLKYYSKKKLEFGLWINEYDGLGGKNGVSISGIKMGNFDVEGAGGYGRFGLNYEYMGYYSKYVQRLWFNIAYIDYSSFDNTDLVVGVYRNVILEDKYSWWKMYFSFYYKLSNELSLTPSFQHFINQFNDTRNALKITLTYKYFN